MTGPSHEPGIAGRVALVTGAAQGIGAAVARALGAAGARVAALDVDAERLAGVAADLGALGHPVTAHVADVRDSAAVDAVVAEVEDRIGPIGLLVNVAGVLRTGPVAALSDEDWRDTFDVNTTGVFHCCRAVARRMVPRGTGAIVTVSSNTAGVARMRLAAYAASKAATSHFMRCLGLELAAHGIRCNVVAPGSTDTGMQRAIWTAEVGPREIVAGSLATYRLGIPLGRIARPEDIADAVLFLASDRARHITMQDVYVDGGATTRA
jgi:2,3-dihydro-2,3-dihydroxybenzoate dehydrogenase